MSLVDPRDLTLPRLSWTGTGIDRAGERRSDTLVAELLAQSDTRVFEVWQGMLRSGAGLRVRAPQAADQSRPGVFLGTVSGRDFIAVDCDQVADPTQWQGLRDRALVLPTIDNQLAVQAVAMLNWHRKHRHCAQCGAPTEMRAAGYERQCPLDQSQHYPRTDPAVIMSVIDDLDRILLGRHPAWPRGQFSTLAGFVEPGESLEAAVRREVLEEAGVVVGRVQYLGSQPWPFPSSLMMGFQSWAVDPAIQVDGVEIEQARWFTRAELAQGINCGELRMSSTLSISRHLIEHWFGGVLPPNQLD